jgi:hypothetical protein
MPDTFYSGTDWQQSSEPHTIVQVHESDCWPVANNSGSGTKDCLAPGLHPVIAIGGRTAADGRPLNITGVVVSYTGAGTGTSTDLVRVNIADGVIVRQYVANVTAYSQGAPDTFETAPVPGQPVYVDDSDDLGEGVTLSMSPLNDSGTLKNPQAGVLWYCQDEYANSQVGGPNEASTFDASLANELVQQEYCVLLFNGSRDLSA